MYNPYMQTPAYGDNVKVVNGRQSAEQYMLYPNSRVLLLDSQEDKFYLKESDASGLSTVRVFSFLEIKEEPKSSFMTREEVEEMIRNYEFNTTDKPKETIKF